MKPSILRVGVMADVVLALGSAHRLSQYANGASPRDESSYVETFGRRN